MTSEQRDALRADLIRDEGIRLAAYTDSAGYLTIGIGRLIDARKPGAGLRHEEALLLCENDIRACFDDLHQFVWFMRLDPVRQRAVLNMRFQLGVGGFRGFRRMIAALERSDLAAAAREGLDSKWASTDTPARARRVLRMLETGLGG